MNKVKIFTDSTSDLTTEILEAGDISVVPLYVNFNDNSFKDGLDLRTEQLYNYVSEYNKLPKTSAPSPTDFYNAFKPFIEQGKDIIYIGLSSGLSSTIQNALIAAKEFPEGRIEVIDSMNLSTGIGLLVMKAVDYSVENLNVIDIADKIRELVPKIRTAFVIDTLDYLYLGGRCSALQNFFGSMLKIRPVVSVVEGKMILRQKLRGKRERALETLLDGVIKDKENIDMTRITVTHSFSKKDALYLKTELEKALDVKDVIITDAGCVISSHCGPNTVGILYIRKN